MLRGISETEAKLRMRRLSNLVVSPADVGEGRDVVLVPTRAVTPKLEKRFNLAVLVGADVVLCQTAFLPS